MITRDLANLIIKKQKDGFITVIYGARRVGKTVLLSQIKANIIDKNAVIRDFNGDTTEAIQALSTNSEVKLTELVADVDYIFIDEAQRIPNISLTLKIIIDKFPQKKVFVTGSSSLELSKGTRENLTGRNLSYILYPFSTSEINSAKQYDEYQLPYLLDNQLIYGCYPYLLQLPTPQEKKDYLDHIVSDYLFKDVIDLDKLDHPDILKKLTSLIGFQIGSEVSAQELSRKLRVDVKTVQRYLSLLEKSFVIFSVGAYSSNMRKEVSKGKKYYFYDLGIRNAVTDQFLLLDSRNDTGKLWENFLFIEKMKQNSYNNVRAHYYFWRNYQGAEIDMIIKQESQISAYEFKWSKAVSKHRTPKNFFDNYQKSAELINKDNYLKFLV